LNVGPLLSDSNTGGFTRFIKDENLVYLGHDFCQVRHKKYDGVHFLPVLKKLVAELKKDPAKYNIPRAPTSPKIEVNIHCIIWLEFPLMSSQAPILSTLTSGKLEQSYVWQRLGKFLKANDIVLAESGTAQFGMPDATFPQNSQYITQIFWSSIGYTVGACLGALVAAKELKHPGRVVLIVGEGSMQMTVQEIGTYIRLGFKPIIFVINNNGYSIERAINGPKQQYNDVSMLWDHQKMLEFFGARKECGIESKSYKCETVEELEKVLTDQDFNSTNSIQVNIPRPERLFRLDMMN
jgi:pyruvate decarboxylase